MPHTVIVSFGCPRSGTTFLAHSLSALQGVFAFRLADGSMLHPSKSTTGLEAVDCLFYDQRLIFVRIIRSPMEIVESFLHLRNSLPSVARAQDADAMIVRWIVNERVNVRAQRDGLTLERDDWQRHSFLEVRYEDIGTKSGRKVFADELAALLPDAQANRTLLLDRLGLFGRRKISYGRMKAGISRSVMTADQREYFLEHLGGTMESDGYA